MKENKGFSMVELIIVIAIMAILVGFIAPLMIVYIEKTNVSSDIQLADTVRTAVMIAITDAKVVSDPASQPYLAQLEGSGINLDTDAAFQTSSCILRQSLEDAFGFQMADIMNHIRSEHGGGCHVFVQVVEGNNVRVTITETDVSAKGDTSSSTPQNDIMVE